MKDPLLLTNFIWIDFYDINCINLFNNREYWITWIVHIVNNIEIPEGENEKYPPPLPYYNMIPTTFRMFFEYGIIYCLCFY